MLKINNLNATIDNKSILNGLSLDINPGEVHAIMGPNGSGKSTFFNLVSGIYDSDPGSYIEFDGHDITFTPPHEIAGYGLSRTFQLLRLYQDMTVLDNVMSGYHTKVPYKFFDAVIGRKKIWDQERAIKEEMMELLSFVGLADYAELNASELSGGQRRLLVLARAIAMKPKLLMLDEPSAGVSPIVMKDLFTKLKSISKMGTSILVVEQNAKQALEISNLGFVLQNGKNKYSDTGKALLQNPEVRVSFLGG